MPYIGSSRFKYAPYLTIHFNKTEQFTAGDAVTPWLPGGEGESGSDTFYADVIFLWHAEDYTDSSPDNRQLAIQWPPEGSLYRLSTSERKFGLSSSYHFGMADVSGTGADMITVLPGPNNIEAEFSADTAYTMEGWIYAEDLPPPSKIRTAFGFSMAGPSDIFDKAVTLDLEAYGHILISYTASGGNATYTSSAKISTKLWTHLALVRDNNLNTTLYINGKATQPVIPYPIQSGRIRGNSGRITVGGQRQEQSILRKNMWHGYLDEIRFTRRHARYTGNFDPPQYAFPNQG